MERGYPRLASGRMVAGVVLAGGRSLSHGAPEGHARVARLDARAPRERPRRARGRRPGGRRRAPGQELPALPFEVVEDAREGEGPLQGIAAGLAALRGRAEIAYVSAVDVPLLTRRSCAAWWRRSATPTRRCRSAPSRSPPPTGSSWPSTAERLLAGGERRARALLEHVQRELAQEPGPESLDDPAAYEAARARPAPLVTVDGRPVGRRRSGRAARGRRSRAAARRRRRASEHALGPV